MRDHQTDSDHLAEINHSLDELRIQGQYLALLTAQRNAIETAKLAEMRAIRGELAVANAIAEGATTTASLRDAWEANENTADRLTAAVLGEEGNDAS